MYPSEKKTHTFSYNDTNFLIDEQPIQLFSGELHYQRIPKEYWRHRLQMARAMGLNAVAIYMFWNAHEPKPGEYDFKGRNDVAQFVKIAQEENLWVIIRPGPYCCAEWDMGGLPPYLLKYPNIRVRCMDSNYVKAAQAYIKRWSQELEPLQCTKGGPIVMVQVENEYGSYGNDKEYLRVIKNTLEKSGFEVPFFTCDGYADHYLINGTLPEILCGVNFGHEPKKAFDQLEKHRKDIPHMCFEYYPGWFTHWGNRKSHHTNIARIKQIESQLEWMITHNKSFNLYMFHGGTNFGYMAGANMFDKYKPDITSYDYSSPVSESGNATNQFHAYRDLLAKYQPKGQKLPPIPEDPKKIETPLIEFSQSAALFDNLPEPISSPQLHSMEFYDLSYGLILYRKRVINANCGRKTIIRDLHDYGHVFLDGKRIATFNRPDCDDGKASFKMPSFESEKAILDILVESHGRVNYGSHILDRKGITEFVSYQNAATLMGWEIYPIATEEGYLDTLKFNHDNLNASEDNPAFYKAHFDLEEIGDTFLDTRGWKKGMVWINGHNLGRYWEVGTKYTLYVPGPWLNEGKNEIILLDLEGPQPRKRVKKLLKKEWKVEVTDTLKNSSTRPPVKGLNYPIL